MKCQEIREGFSLWLDGQLDTQEIARLEEHLAGCVQCREEFSQWQQISTALQSLGRETANLQAPAGFEALVMQQVSQLNKRRTWISLHLRKIVASAAALALLTYGSLELVPQIFYADPSATIVRHEITGHEITGLEPALNNNGVEPLPNPEDNPGADISATGNEPDQQIPGAETTPPPAASGSDPEHTPSVNPDAASNADAGSESGLPQPDRNFTLAQANLKEPMSFLNKERIITSTLIRLQVAELQTAQTKAQNAGQGSKAAYKVFDVQSSGGGPKTITRFTCPREQAAGFIASLLGLGGVIDLQNENQNITAQFTDTLEQYRALVAQLNESSQTQQQTRLRSQIKTLEQQLTTWDEEADDQIIILYLEQ